MEKHSVGEAQSAYMDVKEVARTLECTVDHVYKLCRADRLPHVRFGKRYRFPRRTMEQFLKNQDAKMDQWLRDHSAAATVAATVAG